MTNASDSSSTTVSSPWDAATGWSAAIMSAAGCIQGYASACASWQQESARFLDRRLAANQRTWAALWSAPNPADAVKTQQEWALETTADYANEATRLARLATTLALTGTTPEVQDTAAIMG